MSTPPSDSAVGISPASENWCSLPSEARFYVPVFPRPSRNSLVLAIVLFLLTLCTCLAAGTQFAAAFANNEAVSWDEFLRAFTLFYKAPSALIAGLPFAATLLTILLAHELGHYFACRRHHISSTYPFFIPFPSLIGTFGAFILIRSPIRTTRALFDVGASGPFIGFLLAMPPLVYGIAHAKIVPGLNDLPHAGVVFATPLLLRLLSALFHPGTAPGLLLLHPVGRAAWVGLFATALNLLPSGQLDGGHILRSVNPRLHRALSLVLPFVLLSLGWILHWIGWFVWAAILFALLFLRKAPFYDETPLDPARRALALLAVIILVLCFMPAPILIAQDV